jgi:hypothetical protein
MVRNSRLARWLDNERVLNRVVIGALFLLLFLMLGFEHGWARAALQCLIFVYCVSLMRLAASICLAASLQGIREDKSTHILAVFTIALGLTAYILAGQRAVLHMSLLGVMCGSVIGGVMRFAISGVGRGIGRSERRLVGRARKMLNRKRRQ